jgi:predicted small lipoprotein YifL
MKKLILLVFACFLAGCGQIGPLYIPPANPPQQGNNHA